MEKRGDALCAYYGPECVKCRAVIISGAEKGIVVPALKLEAGFEYFARDVDEGGGKIS